MSIDHDNELMQCFLTEAVELIEQLDTDLVRLESITDEAAACDLLNSVFRALHTVKGSASFLGLTTVTSFSHVAEDALNRLRKGEVELCPSVMDALLQSVDVLRAMIEELASGGEPDACPQELLSRLHAICSSASMAQAEGDTEASAPTVPAPIDENERAIKLPEQKRDLVGFMIDDLREASTQIEQALLASAVAADRADTSADLLDIAQGLERTLAFFEIDEDQPMIKAFTDCAVRLAQAEDAEAPELTVRLLAAARLIQMQAEALSRGRVALLPTTTLVERMDLLAQGRPLPAEVVGRHAGDVDALLRLDGVVARPGEAAPVDEATADEPQVPDAGETVERRAGDERRAGEDRRAAGRAPAAEATIRVEVPRLETLLNLVGQMVLTKNRVLGASRRLRDQDLSQELSEDVAAAAGDLDRLTSELQVAVMRTRMQPLAKLFDRYPRVIRDIARATSKQIELELLGKDTEVDKSVLELLADPLVHILRNSADHGIEPPADREAKGKPAFGTIRLLAEHQGSHVRLAVHDDGRGIDREIIGRKAIEKGLTTADALSAMPDEEVYRFIFAPGFSTAAAVTDLSGRGVGMDVVQTNVNKMGGTINVSSNTGRGTCIEILIPLTVAIMPAMVVGIGEQDYCVPLQSVVEIVRLNGAAVHQVNGQPVMRLRDSVLPLIDTRKRLGETGVQGECAFAVVVSVAGNLAALITDRLIGQQEIVVKPLDDLYARGGPFCGATIMEDGQVSLIMDLPQLVRSTGHLSQAA